MQETSLSITLTPPKPRKLSDDIKLLVEAFAERSVSLADVVSVLQGRGFTLLLVLLALPFCTPIPLPGLSTPFGLVIALIGFRLALRLKPWLPGVLADKKLPPRFFAKVLGAASRLVRSLEWLLRPRLTQLVDAKLLQHLYGAVICLCGLLLLLPLPIPFSNFFPAFTVVLIGSALLERDGYALIAGLIMFSATVCFFSVILWGGAEAVGWLKDWFGRFSDGD